jgi:putative acyl-CoA dehydrogenase
LARRIRRAGELDQCPSRHGHPAVADAFCASRLAGDWGWALGTLPPGLALDAIVERATPKVG